MAEILVQRQQVDILGRAGRGAFAIIAPAPAGGAHSLPVRGPIAGARIALAIDEGLHQHHPLAIALLPIPGQTARTQGQHLGGQVGNLHCGQNQKAAVTGHLLQIGAPRRIAPFDPPVTRAQLPGRATEAQRGHCAIARAVHQIAHLPPAQRLITQRVIGRHQLPKAPRATAVPADHLHRELSEISQLPLNHRRPYRWCTHGGTAGLELLARRGQ